MIRLATLAALVMAVFGWNSLAWAGAADEIVSEQIAASHGLTRAWVMQMEMDHARSRVRDVVLDGDGLFVLSNQSLLQAYDAETGKPLWANGQQFGKPQFPSFTPAVNHSLVAVTNGSHVYVLNRYTGAVLWDDDLPGTPGAGCALSDRRVFVPLLNGRVMAYRLTPIVDPLKDLGKAQDAADAAAYTRENLRLSQEYAAPLACQSAGMATVRPIVTWQSEDEEYVVWPTSEDFMFVGVLSHFQNTFSTKLRIKMEADIAAPATYVAPPPAPPPKAKVAKPAGDDDAADAEKPAADADEAKPAKLKAKSRPKEPPNRFGIVVVVSESGVAFAVDLYSGDTIWQFSVNEPMVQPAAVVGDRVYLATQLGGLHCLDLTTGARKWWTPGIVQFLALTKDRIYSLDRLGRLVFVSPQTGGVSGSMALPSQCIGVANTQTDRIYLASPGGLIQCLRQENVVQPIIHTKPRQPLAFKHDRAPDAGTSKQPGEKPGAKAKEKPAAKPAAKPKEKPGANPFGGDANPFGN